MERAVKRGLQRREAESVTKIGVDEKAFRKGHSYFTLVNDLVRGRVMYVAEGRQQSSLDGFWEALTEEQKQSTSMNGRRASTFAGGTTGRCAVG